MLYRKKILLAILNEFGGTLQKLSLQKLLFLFSKECSQQYYEFLPYKYGAYSFAANTDLVSLKKAGYLTETEKTWKIVTLHKEDIAIEPADYTGVAKLKKTYSDLNAADLVKYTYQNYPYYAINSVIARRMLAKGEFESVLELKNARCATGLFTIGYEGKTVDSYFILLLQNGIKLLCDVRKNAFSMKVGFSKSQLKMVCDSVGIAYLHYPELGIASELRKDLHTQDDYNKLFLRYEQESLTKNLPVQQQLLEDLNRYGNAALTCFENDHNCCHRSRLAKSLLSLSNGTITLKHL